MEVSRIKGVAVIGLSGFLEGSAVADDFVATVQDLRAQGNRCMVVDMSALEHAGSPLVGALGRCLDSYRQCGGRVVICGVAPGVRNLFALLKDRLWLFEDFPDRSAAVASFEPGHCPEW